MRQTLPPLLRELPPDEHEILVVDDASEDESVEVLGRDFPAVRVVALKENVGFGAACNRGVEEAGNELVLLLNSDMEVTPASIGVLAEHFSEPEVFAAGPRYAEPGDATALPDGGRELVRPELGSPAGGGLFSRAKFLDLGGFDPLYRPFYWEDLDLGWRAWRAGWRVIYDGRVHFLHLGSATIARLYGPEYVARVRARNRALFGWRNFRSPGFRRRHNWVLARRAVVDLIRRRDAASLRGLWDAWRMRAEAAPRARSGADLTDEQILTQLDIDLDLLLRV